MNRGEWGLKLRGSRGFSLSEIYCSRRGDGGGAQELATLGIRKGRQEREREIPQGWVDL